jgi:hypothetical protein
VADVKNLRQGAAQLSLFTNVTGGILDDTIISRHDGYLHVVSNAGCADKISLHLKRAVEEFKSKGKQVQLEHVRNGALLALQGTTHEKKKVGCSQLKLTRAIECTSSRRGEWRVLEQHVLYEWSADDDQRRALLRYSVRLHWRRRFRGSFLTFVTRHMSSSQTTDFCERRPGGRAL